MHTSSASRKSPIVYIGYDQVALTHTICKRFFYLELHLDAPVTDGERMKAAKLIQAVWRHIGRALGFQNDILNEIESSKGDNRDRALTMLDEWSDRHGNCAIRRHLIKAMMEEGYTTQVAEVFPGKN